FSALARDILPDCGEPLSIRKKQTYDLPEIALREVAQMQLCRGTPPVQEKPDPAPHRILF
ncbi:MAG: hypothetical protein PVG97_00270, partial [Syntrophobacterales bacterium]